MINYLRFRSRRRRFVCSLFRRLCQNRAADCEERRSNKPGKCELETGVFHTPTAAQPREGNLTYLNPESVEIP